MAMGIGIAACFVIVCCLMGYLFYRQMKLWYIMSKFPGPKAYPLIGNAYQFDTDPRAFFTQLNIWVDEHRSFGLIGFQMLFSPILFLLTPDGAEPEVSRCCRVACRMSEKYDISTAPSGFFKYSTKLFELYGRESAFVSWSGPVHTLGIGRACDVESTKLPSAEFFKSVSKNFEDFGRESPFVIWPGPIGVINIPLAGEVEAVVKRAMTVVMEMTGSKMFFQLMTKWSQEYRSSGAIVTWTGPVPAVGTLDCQNVETILSSSKQLDKGLFYNMLKPWLGSGLLISKGNKWHTRRKLLTPSFHFAILTSFVDVFNEHAQTLAVKMTEAAVKKSVNIFPLVTRCTLDIICSTAMGKNIGAQQGKNKEYVQAVIEMSDIVQERQKYPWLWIDTIYNQLPSGKKHSQNLQILHTLTKSVILLRRADRKRERQQGKKIDVIDDETQEVRKKRKLAFLDLLLEVHEQDSSFTLEDIREEVDTFMFEGHDTTASGTSWTLFLLGHHPEIQKRVQDELDKVFGNDRNRPVTNDDIQKLTYLNCVVKEALRICPPVPLIARQLEEDTVLSGNFVPKNTITVIGIYWLHRDPKQFPNPEKFDPDRFLPENSKGRHPFAYVPFSAGPRNCIGQKFALMEEKVILATLLRKLSFRSLQSMEEISPIGELILRPYKNMEMEITLRS